ncbi:glycoside hydrolase family 127 protein [Salegentibacter salegens]|uniref:Uncharacterized protein n=1 Tax=Salegentibacter salegens TaxID=143223 RepID=A0A1M7N4S8_9FLAO|nr:glycoside hydrolase family 127 protein [Salegentibacter salegens]PRX46851.1 hypothetical protein LY58_01535 [Salegentibacter salegens]SHM98479.1 hypothetical protein SAMN05878281_2876 [Salegentibacter salegens]
MKLLFKTYYCTAILVILSLASGHCIFAQNSETRMFHLEDVKLSESMFKEAMHTDLDYILKLDPDKLLAPFLAEAGLEPREKSYTNWENTGLDGHTAGHYLTALAQMYASANSEEARHAMEYAINELKRVQDANANGYIGGVPGGEEIWNEIANGNINAGNFSLNDRWVPLYNIHKTYAGLRDAYLIAGNELALEMLIDFTDWMLDTTAQLSDAQMQEILISEHGGLNEVFADVAQITGESKYLELAKRFSHRKLLDPLARNKDVLNGMHANTQIPKIIGFETIASLNGESDYHQASTFFWDNVVNQRTVAIGGNSVREHFHPTDDFSEMIASVQGPETCNTYNMLRLSEKLFLAEPDEKYIDYYETALYNHILSSQHPEEGGFVYFTPMRPGHYRVYSQPETSFWCCVGSGMENHGKYNQFIYAHTNDALFVNLFISSELDWQEKNLKLVQNTGFPNSESTNLTIETEEPQTFKLRLRYPDWAIEGELEIFINNKLYKHDNKPGSYVEIDRVWENGDEIHVKFPMKLDFERLPDDSDFVALKYGPIILATKLGDKDLEGQFADDSRGGHIAEGEKIALSDLPVFLAENDENWLEKIKRVNDQNLKFSAEEIIFPQKFKNLEFVPFYEIHEARYAIYLPIETPESYENIQKERAKSEKIERDLAELTIDQVAPGEQQPESDHFIKSEESNTGVNLGEHWRDASGWFSYELKDDKNQAQKIRLTYFGKDVNRKFRIFINGIEVGQEHFEEEKAENFYTKDYQLPKKITEKNIKRLTIRIEAESGFSTAGVYDIKLMK